MNNRERQKKPNWGGLIALALILAPGGAIPLLILAGIVYVVFQVLKNKQPDASGKTTYTRAPEALDDCPKQLFCFHKDKSEHHVARGKEMDPWDRPDIDISKYQRNH